MFHPRRYDVGDKIGRSFVNEAVDAANALNSWGGVPGDTFYGVAQSVSRGGMGSAVMPMPGAYGVDWRDTSSFGFIGKIMPTGYPPEQGQPAPDYEDARYWVAEVIDGTDQDAPQERRNDLLDPEQLRIEEKFDEFELRWTTAVNLAEYEDDSHTVPHGTIVRVEGSRSPGGRIRYSFNIPAVAAAEESVLLTSVNVTEPLVVRGRRVRPTEDKAVWLVNDGEDDPGEEEFRTEFGIPAIHYKAFEWPNWQTLNSKATFLPLKVVVGEGGSYLYVAQKPKIGLPVEPPDLTRWPRSECWLF